MSNGDAETALWSLHRTAMSHSSSYTCSDTSSDDSRPVIVSASCSLGCVPPEATCGTGCWSGTVSREANSRFVMMPSTRMVGNGSLSKCGLCAGGSANTPRQASPQGKARHTQATHKKTRCDRCRRGIRGSWVGHAAPSQRLHSERGRGVRESGVSTASHRRCELKHSRYRIANTHTQTHTRPPGLPYLAKVSFGGFPPQLVQQLANRVQPCVQDAVCACYRVSKVGHAFVPGNMMSEPTHPPLCQARHAHVLAVLRHNRRIMREQLVEPSHGADGTE